MIISHRLKFAFFRVPKTGSFTAETMIRLSNAFDKNDLLSPISGMPNTIPRNLFVPFYKDRFTNFMKGEGAKDEKTFAKKASRAGTLSYLSHITPADAVRFHFITKQQLKEYKCFAFLREPYDRHLSAYAYRMGVMLIPEQYKKAVKEHQFSGENLLFKPVTEYFFVDGEQVCEPLMFSDYANELRRCVAAVNGYNFAEIPRLNASKGRAAGYSEDAFYDDEVRAILKEELAQDLAFYEANKTKKK